MLSKTFFYLTTLTSLALSAAVENVQVIFPETILSRSGSVVGQVGQNIYVASDGSEFVLDWGKQVRVIFHPLLYRYV